jgi:hypothetical protein
LHKLVLPWVTRKYIDAVLSMEAFQRAAAPTIQVELPTVPAMTSNPDLAVGECQKTHLDMAVGGGGARSLDMLAARSLLEVVAAM